MVAELAHAGTVAALVAGGVALVRLVLVGVLSTVAVRSRRPARRAAAERVLALLLAPAAAGSSSETNVSRTDSTP